MFKQTKAALCLLLKTKPNPVLLWNANLPKMMYATNSGRKITVPLSVAPGGKPHKLPVYNQTLRVKNDKKMFVPTVDPRLKPQIYAANVKRMESSERNVTVPHIEPKTESIVARERSLKCINTISEMRKLPIIPKINQNTKRLRELLDADAENRYRIIVAPNINLWDNKTHEDKGKPKYKDFLPSVFKSSFSH